MGLHNKVVLGKGALGDIRQLNVKKYGKYYYLIDDTRGIRIETQDAKMSGNEAGLIWLDRDGRFIKDYDAAAVDAHYYAGVVADFWKEKFNRNSYDNLGSPIRSVVHFGSKYNNAFWNGSKMVYGDGDGTEYRPLSASLDVVAHELTHAVIGSELSFTYQGESGALEEALADIFAVQVEKYHKRHTTWELGEDAYTPHISNDALRSIANPKKYDGIDHYNDRYTGTDDKGGVHWNSTIIGKVAHLIAVGGVHYGVVVQGIGMDKMGWIFYNAILKFFGNNTNFSEAKTCLIQSVRDLHGLNSLEEESVVKAFNAVGIL